MSNPSPDRVPKPQPARSDGPPRPPKRAGQGLADAPPELPYLDIPNPIVLKDLATAIGLKPFVLVADLMRVGRFAKPGDSLDFGAAAMLAKKHGFQARKIS